MEESEELKTFSALVCTGKTHLQQSQVPETHGNVWRKEELRSLEKNQFREHLNKRDVHKSTGPDGRHPQVLTELDNVSARPLNNL